MCNRHSFCVDRAGHVLDGMGLTDSHTEMLDLHGVPAAKHDTYRLYEWQPPEGWPDADALAGLTRDGGADWTEKKSHLDAITAHVKARYPDMVTWGRHDAIDSAADGMTLAGARIVLGTYEASDSATVRAFGSATVRAFDSATVEAFDSATVRAFDSATVRASGSATVRASGSATVMSYCRGGIVLRVGSSAVCIDRSGPRPKCRVARAK